MKLSVVTINRNDVKGLEKTILSVIAQKSQDFEYIIIDGASTDGSKELIERLAIDEERLRYWCSEPDLGIYNAMNKGIKKAKGDYCLFLNSGDYLYSDKVIADFCENDFKEEIVSGRIFEDDFIFDELSFELFYFNSLPHPSTFICRELFSRYGLYNEKNKIVSDWEFFLKVLVQNNCSYHYWDYVVTVYDLNGITSKPELSNFHGEEKKAVMQKQIPLVYKTYIKQQEQINKLMLHEERYEEYMKLRSGNFLCIIRIMLWINRKIEQWKNYLYQ